MQVQQTHGIVQPQPCELRCGYFHSSFSVATFNRGCDLLVQTQPGTQMRQSRKVIEEVCQVRECRPLIGHFRINSDQALAVRHHVAGFEVAVTVAPYNRVSERTGRGFPQEDGSAANQV